MSNSDSQVSVPASTQITWATAAAFPLVYPLRDITLSMFSIKEAIDEAKTATEKEIYYRRCQVARDKSLQLHQRIVDFQRLAPHALKLALRTVDHDIFSLLNQSERIVTEYLEAMPAVVQHLLAMSILDWQARVENLQVANTILERAISEAFDYLASVRRAGIAVI